MPTQGNNSLLHNVFCRQSECQKSQIDEEVSTAQQRGTPKKTRLWVSIWVGCGNPKAVLFGGLALREYLIVGVEDMLTRAFWGGGGCAHHHCTPEQTVIHPNPLKNWGEKLPAGGYKLRREKTGLSTINKHCQSRTRIVSISMHKNLKAPPFFGQKCQEGLVGGLCCHVVQMEQTKYKGK